ncbi:glycosyltransferase family 2 protein [Candidatus Parcubacteria bacterium]|nr:glycosyltransferase family 2 protein [Candidatus Parcubacteria bacterium]
MDYLKIGKATELLGKDYKLYRVLEILPGFLSWSTILLLLIFSYFYPVVVAFFIIAFDVYWLLLVFYLGIHLLSSYRKTKKNMKIDWRNKLYSLDSKILKRTDLVSGKDIKIKIKWDDVIHLIIFPIACESLEVISQSVKAITETGYLEKNMILVLSVEERGGSELKARAEAAKKEFAKFFRNFIVTTHPDGLVGELKGKGANQSWAAKIVEDNLIDKNGLDYDKILVSVFDIDTVVYPDYFHCLTYKFLTVKNPYRASYQPIPLYHNNVWQASFFARVAASSNTFWQMMQQIRQEKLATYSSHSMTWRALVEAGFWGKTMVSEDSRIFWHCFCNYNGDYRVEPLYYPVSMDVTMDDTVWQTAKNLYKQQRRWGWGVENIPYLLFNGIKRWPKFKKGKLINRIFVQLYGFHSWATNALIIGFIGWMPMFLGGDRFNATVLSTNLPVVTRALMTLAMLGLVLSAILSTILLPKKPKKYGFFKYAIMFLQWLVLPFSIVIFGAIPGLDAQTRLMFGKYLGFFITPKSR